MRADGIEENTMPKKDTAAAVIGMLSTAGAQTRRTPEATAAAEDEAAAPGTVTVTEVAPAPVTTLPTPVRPTPATATAPRSTRTSRLRPVTAQRLRRSLVEAGNATTCCSPHRISRPTSSTRRWSAVGAGRARRINRG